MKRLVNKFRWKGLLTKMKPKFNDWKNNKWPFAEMPQNCSTLESKGFIDKIILTKTTIINI